MDRDSALAASRSGAWQERALAAEALTAYEDADARAALVALLNDEDLAVVRRAVAGLLTVATTSALKLFTASYVGADNQSGDSMNDELRVAVALNATLRPALVDLAASGDAGARAALAWLA